MSIAIISPLSSNITTSFPHNPINSPLPILSFNLYKANHIVYSSYGNKTAKFANHEYRNKDFDAVSSKPTSHSAPNVKNFTAPWMKGPLTVERNQIVEFSKNSSKGSIFRRIGERPHEELNTEMLRRRKDSIFRSTDEHPDEELTGKVYRSSKVSTFRRIGQHPDENLNREVLRSRKDSSFRRIRKHPDEDLTGKVSGGRGKKAMKKIFQGIEKLQDKNDLGENETFTGSVNFKFSPGDLWGDENFEHDVAMQHNTQKSLELDFPLSGVEKQVKLKQMPWERDGGMVVVRVKKEKVKTKAELNLDEMLLMRLRNEAALMKKWVKVKKAGVTQAVVDQVKFMWRTNELALLKFDLPLCRNMERAQELVEMKTGGFVVWTKGDFLAVYRGCSYLPGSESDENVISTDGNNSNEIDGACEDLHINGSLYEREADRLLDGLGPRFDDWWMKKPLPVDGDLLPEIVPGFQPPKRRCPPFTISSLTNSELTYLRKLARPLPTHFVLGRNRKLQGLAAAILKLWEKCHIAKIALKWGVPNTDNEEMANELKNLTGGVLLLRNKFLIILYRGKDFIPSQVAELVSQREMELTNSHLEEELARLKASENFSVTEEHLPNSGIIGTLSEFRSIQPESRNVKEVDVKLEAERERLEKELRNQEQKLFILKKKMEKASKMLETLNRAWKPSDIDGDREMITQEERKSLRDIGLRMDNCLVLGRRGIFVGVIEGIHQHWKHREVVKVITMQKKFSEVIHTANFLEAESCGILVSVEKLKEGHAIIIYRGKNYKRPKLAHKNLLKKREALSKSLELQRGGSLKFFAKQREQAILGLRHKLAQLTEKRHD